jgi:hypothetical protein
MVNFNLKETLFTPLVSLDYSSGEFQIKGKSIPTNSVAFYSPILKWLDNYSKNPPLSTALLLDLEYFNTGSSKCLYEFLKKLKFIQDSGKVIKITWLYDKNDEGIHEAGEDFRSLIELPMEIKVKHS